MSRICVLAVIVAVFLSKGFSQSADGGQMFVSLYVDREVLYAGIDNVVAIESSEDLSQLKVDFPGCKVEHLKDNQYKVSVPSNWTEPSVIAEVKSGGGEVDKRFRVVKVPDPFAVLGLHLRNGKYSVDQLLHLPKLWVMMHTDFPYDIVWKVVCYKVEIVGKNGKSKIYACDGPDLPEAVCAAIRSAESGTVIFFEDIKATSTVGTRLIENFVVRVK